MTDLEKLQTVADNINGKLRSYSGRGMYGKVCAGISCEDSVNCIVEAAECGIRGERVDSLGLGYIVYWPNIAYSKD